MDGSCFVRGEDGTDERESSRWDWAEFGNGGRRAERREVDYQR